MEPDVIIGVLLPFRPGTPPAPEERPLGRAALFLQQQGVEVVFGQASQDGHLIGFTPRPGGWRQVERPPAILYNRFPSFTEPERFTSLVGGLQDIPIANPLAFEHLCRDKIQVQHLLQRQGVEMPPIETDPTRFQERLAHWGRGFLKPRFGSFGLGIQPVTFGDKLPTTGVSLRPEQPEPLFLQQAIAPPEPFAGHCLRILVQRSGPKQWHPSSVVARVSMDDPVANVRRGATAVPGDHVCNSQQLAAVAERSVTIAKLLADHTQSQWLVELGLDFVVSRDGQLYLLEINAKPGGRLSTLASEYPQFESEHIEACSRPFRYLASAMEGPR